VSRIDGDSRNNKRPRGVAQSLQVSQHIVECQRDEPSNVFANDPSGSSECNDFAHRRPEVAVVGLRSLFAGVTEWLAREAAADKVDSSEPTQSVCIKRADVIEAGHVGPMLSKDGATEIVGLAECNGTHTGSLETEAESTNATEEVEDIH
jgi:hypothetical protein